MEQPKCCPVKKAEHWRTDAFELWCKTLESPLDCKEIQPIHSKGDQSWVFFGRTDAEAETPILWPPFSNELTHWKRPWCGEGLGAGGEGDDRGWDGWMASPTRWTWVWVNSGSWGWTGRPGVLRLMGSQRVGHDWATELNWTKLKQQYEPNSLVHKEFRDSLLCSFHHIIQMNWFSSQPQNCANWNEATPLLLKVWSLDQHHQYHLKACHKCRIPSPIPDLLIRMCI